jgi:hypothetical protein
MLKNNKIVGSGGGCFRAGSQVQLEGGKTISIELLKEGDEILSFDERGDIHLARVIKTHHHSDPQPILRTRFWRGEFFPTPNHWVLNQYDSFAEIGRMTESDALVDGMGHLRTIISQELVGYEPVYNLTVEPNHTYIVDDIRVHNGGHRERYPVITGSGMGGDKGGGGRAAVEASDTIWSRASLSLIDLIGEGEIGGLVDGGKSIYLNDTPLISASGQANFEGVSWDQRVGTPNQAVMKGFRDIETPYVVGVEVLKASPQVFTINNQIADRVRIIVSIPSLFAVNASNGDTTATTLHYQFEIATDGGAYQPLGQPIIISAKTAAKYQRSHIADLPKPGSSWSIRLTRITDDSASLGLANKLFLDSYVEISDLKLNYPNSALVSMSLHPETFSSVPRRSYRVRGLYIQIPSNYDPVTRQYTGVWDGTFKLGISSNPAWVLYDLAVTKRYGLGEYISPAQISAADLYKIGKYCDELVPDGYGGTEPRFTINTVISNRAEAYKVISNITSVFRGMSYWSGGEMGITQDSPSDPTMIYSQANVKDGVFNYTSSAKKDRHSVVLVTWNNPANYFKQEIEYVDDQELVNQMGIRQLETVAFGCSSRGQARRAGKWILYTERYESSVISFTVGSDSTLVMPGEIVKIHDAFKAGKRFAGRVVAASTDGLSVTFDAPVSLDSAGATLSLKMPDGTLLDRTIVNDTGEYVSVTVSEAIASTDLSAAMFVITEPSLEPQLARIVAISEGDQSGEYVISAVEHNASKFNAVDFDMPIFEPNTSIGDELFATSLATPTGLTAQLINVATELGLTRNLLVSWDRVKNPYIRCYVLMFKIDDGDVQIAKDIDFSITLNNVVSGTYYFELRAQNLLGSVSAPSLGYTYTVTPLYAIQDVSVINVGVKGAGSEFMGRNAELHWDTDADTVLNLPMSFSNGRGGNSQWFRDFEINIYTEDGLTLLRTDYTTEYSYSYTFEKNVEDGGPRRSFKVEIRARDEFGNYSNVGTLTPINMPPMSGGGIAMTPKEGSLSVVITPPDDPDYSYCRIFGSRVSGFTPSDDPDTGNLLYSGSDAFLNIPINYAASGNWYLRAQFVDEFGVSGAIYSGEGYQLVVNTLADLPGVAASEILSVITDFNASNNRNANTIIAPVIAGDGTAIDHTLNTDGSINLSVEWAWGGDEADIDGFVLAAYASTSPSAHTFTGSSSEIAIQMPMHSRSYIHHGIPAFKNNGDGTSSPLYYTIGVLAYRKVDGDIATDGVIHSPVAMPPLAAENPYCPSTAIAGTGDITATIDGILAANVNKWQYVSGPGRPYDNADVTKDQISGSGVNILNARYALIEESSIPPYLITGGSASLNATLTPWNISVIRLTATSPLAVLTLAANTADYNIMLTPGRKWLLSAYVRSGTANASGTLSVRGSDGNAYDSFDFLTSPTPDTVTRVSGVIDGSANASSLALLRLENDAGSGVYIDFTGLMMEELIGNAVAPSAFVRPTMNSVAGMPLDQVLNHIVDFTAGNNRNGTAIVAPTVASDNTALDYSTNTDGSANVSFEWSWAGNPGDIDGFVLAAYATSSDHGVYNFGTNPSAELVVQVPSDRRSYIAFGVAADAYYTLAVCAYRSVDKDINESGVIISDVVYPSGSTERPFRPSSTIVFNGNITGTVGNVLADAVAAATTDTTGFRTAGAPSNQPVIGAISASGSGVGTVDITVTWTYTQGALRADQFILYAVEGTTNPTTSSALFTTVDGNARSIRLPGVPADKSYKIGIVAARTYSGGLQAGPIVNAWTRTGETANITANIAGTAASTVVNNASSALSTANSASSTASSALSTANSASSTANSAYSGLSNKLNKSAADTLSGTITLNTGGSILAGTTTNGVYMASTGLVGVKGGVTTFSIDSSGNAVFKGDINSGGVATFNGSNSYGGFNFAITANESGNQFGGLGVASGSSSGSMAIFAVSNASGGYGVKSSASGAGSYGGYFDSSSSTGYGVYGYAASGVGVQASTSTGTALAVSGKMTINNSDVVTNLNANYLEGYTRHSFCQLVVTNSGTANVSGAGLNLYTGGSLAGSFRFTGSGNVIYLTDVSDASLKKDILPEVLGLEFINKLQPSTYKMKDGSDTTFHGFIAQDVAALLNNAANIDSIFTESEDGIKGVGYISLISPLVRAIQELTERVDNLQKQLGN